MAGKSTKSWSEIRGQKPLNEARVATYRRLMDAEARLDAVRRRRGIGDGAIAEAVEIKPLPDGTCELEDEVYLATLGRYVAALGGRLELVAIFSDETITLPRPGGASDQSES